MDESEKVGPSERFDRGAAILAAVDGTAGAEVVAPLGDLGRYIVEFAFGDIYARPGLGLRDRELVTVGLLVGLGGREPQLRVHFGAALNVGVTAAELEEVIIHTVPYTGFPTAINGLTLLRNVLSDRDGRMQHEPTEPAAPQADGEDQS